MKFRRWSQDGEEPAVEQSRLELVVGKDGIPAGAEVTISYGNWPNEVFLLLFGFVPMDNPADTVTLFVDLDDWLEAAASSAISDWADTQHQQHDRLLSSATPDFDAVKHRICEAMTPFIVSSGGATPNEHANQRFFFSRCIGEVTPKTNYFSYLEKSFLDRSIPKIIYLNLKTEALTPIVGSVAAYVTLKIIYFNYQKNVFTGSKYPKKII